MIKRNFPNFIEAFMQYTSALPAPEKFLRWSAVSVLAATMERRCWIKYNGASVYPNQFIMLIGPPGLSRKSSSSGKAIDLLKSVPSIRFVPDSLTQASLIKAVHESGQPEGRKVILNGEQYRNSSVYIYSSEAVVTIKEAYGSMVEIMTDLYDGGPNGWHNDRSWEKSTMIDGNIKIFNPCLNMLACSTPDWLVKIVGHNAIRGGFFSRVLFIAQFGRVDKKDVWTDDGDELNEDTRKLLIEDLNSISKVCGQFKVTDEVKKLHNFFLESNTNFIAANQADRFISYYARKPWHLLKLSQAMSINESNEMIVYPRHWIQAKEILEATEHDSKLLFNSTGKNEDHVKLVELWNDLRHNFSSFTKPQVLARHHRDVSSKDLTDFLITLRDMGKLKAEIRDGRVLYQLTNKDPL